MTAKEILAEMKKMENPAAKKMLAKHGAVEPYYGIKIEDLKKKFVKPIKKDYKLSLELYDSGISDAMYLAGLIADEKKMTRKDLQKWVEKAPWSMISEYTVPWIAAESNYGWELALEWIESKSTPIAVSGWATLSSLVAIKPDEELDIKKLKSLITRVTKEIHHAPNKVKYVMNGFVISAGCYIPELTDEAMEAAKKMGVVTVDMGDTSCKVPSAADYIKKVKDRKAIGKKKKMARC